MTIHSWDNGQEIVDIDDNPITSEEDRYNFFEMMRNHHLEMIREERNRIISETDWSQLDDIDSVTKEKWKAYRQELRDITNHYDHINEVIWPEKPE